jgi:Flp pilus assembly protein TadG
MRTPHNHLWSNSDGTAAVEFAIVAPILLMILGGLADFGLYMVGKSQLANALAQGAQYALLQGPSVSGTSIQSMVSNGASRAGVTATVAVSVTGPACYCTSGEPVALVTPSTALTASYTCTGTCSGTGAALGAYVIITATYSYQPLMPLYSQLVNATVTETATIRLL